MHALAPATADAYHRGVATPLDLIPPGEILLEEFLTPLGISQNRLARDLDLSPGAVNEIVKGKRRISADMALRLGKYFGTTPDFWLGLQTEYDVRKARRDTWPEVEPRIRTLKKAG